MLLPGIGIDVGRAFPMCRDLMVAFRITGRIDDAGVVSAIGENECHVRIRQHLDFVGRPPGCDMIGDGTDREERHVDVT